MHPSICRQCDSGDRRGERGAKRRHWRVGGEGSEIDFGGHVCGVRVAAGADKHETLRRAVAKKRIAPTTKSATTTTHLPTNHFPTNDDFNAPIPLASFGGAFRRSEASRAPVCFVLLKGNNKCPGRLRDAMLCIILHTCRAGERLLNDRGLRVIP